jgi:hypothetical protein
MASHALRKSSRVRAAGRRLRVNVRRHVPFTVYAVATAAVALWTICRMVCITR